MKLVRAILLLVAAALVGLGIWNMYFRDHRPRVAPAPKPASTTPAATTKPEVAIQDGKTIDFSSGKPVVKADAAQKAKIDKAVAEMDAAAGNVTFTPQPAAAQPTPAPSTK